MNRKNRFWQTPRLMEGIMEGIMEGCLEKPGKYPH
jgi:hypothetical protein